MPMLAVTNTSSVVSDDRFGDRGEEPLGECRDRLDAREVVAEHHELVAAEARDDVAGPDRMPEPLRDGDDELVAERVAEAVVDDLEVVEVDEQHRDHAVPLPPRECQRDAFGEARPVREPGHGVVRGLVGEAVGERLAIGDVFELADLVHRRCLSRSRTTETLSDAHTTEPSGRR